MGDFLNFFDLHCDTAYRCFTEKKELNDNDLSVKFNTRFFEKHYQTFAFFIPENIACPFEFYKLMKRDFEQKLCMLSNRSFTPVFSVENGNLIEKDLDRIYLLKEDKIRIITLTWNGENQIAGGVGTEIGLKSFGKEVIRKLNDNNIYCDLSHLNKKSFYEALDIAKFPIVTHSCISDVFPHRRNISLDMAKSVAKRNGVIGLCLYPEFLGEDNFLENFYKNVYYCLDFGLEDNISIGSDFDGCEIPFDIGFLPELYTFLEFKGIDKKILSKLFFDNAYKALTNN